MIKSDAQAPKTNLNIAHAIREDVGNFKKTVLPSTYNEAKREVGAIRFKNKKRVVHAMANDLYVDEDHSLYGFTGIKAQLVVAGINKIRKDLPKDAKDKISNYIRTRQTDEATLGQILSTFMFLDVAKLTQDNYKKEIEKAKKAFDYYIDANMLKA